MKTAVEWLVEQLYGNNEIFGVSNDLLEQAKEMEKEQMRAASCPYIGGWEEGEFEYWYNEKFKKIKL